MNKFGTSDHNILEWEIQLSPIYSLRNRPYLDYAQADFSAFRQEMNNIDWLAILQNRLTMLMSSGSHFISC